MRVSDERMYQEKLRHREERLGLEDPPAEKPS